MSLSYNAFALEGPDPTPPHEIDWNLRQSRAAVKFQMTPGGLPMHPMADQLPDLRPSRGDLWHWGEALAIDAIVTVTGPDSRDYLLLIERVDGHGWALPGGMLEPGETPATGCARELAEETGLEVPMGFAEALPSRLVPDPRQGLYAWIVTLPRWVHLGHVIELPQVTGADDATNAAWIPTVGGVERLIDDGSVFAAHTELLRDALTSTT